MIQRKVSVAIPARVTRSGPATGMLASGSWVLVAAAVFIGLSGCGQKGPLTLPKAQAGDSAASSPVVPR